MVVDGLPLSKAGCTTADNTENGHERMLELVNLGERRERER